jgi:hypothetical protein
MQLKTKLFAPLIAILMLGMASSAYASLVCTATVVAVAPRAINNNINAVPGDISISCTAPDLLPIQNTQFSVVYPAPITNSRTSPAGHAIALTSISGIGSTVTWDTTAGTQGGSTGIFASAGTLLLDMPGYTPGAIGPQGGFVISNVLLSLAGTQLLDVRANVNVFEPLNRVTMVGSPVTVIGQVLPALSSTTAPGLTPGTLTAQYTSLGVPVSANRSNFSITVTENFIDAWRTPAQYYAPQSTASPALNSTIVTFTFAGMLPGSQIQNCVASISPVGAQLLLTGSGVAGANGQATLNVEFPGPAGPDPATAETITLQCGQGTGLPAYGIGTSTGPATSSITYNVQMTPLGVNYPGIGGTIQNTVVPRFLAGTTVAGVVVVGFTGATTGQTTMIIPYALGSGAAAPPAGSFDTGIAVANTTKNAAGFLTPAEGGATARSGNVSFTFFPSDGSASFTITPTSGFGLTTVAANCVTTTPCIPSDGSFVASVSEILRAGGNTGGFSGYIIVTANFTHAHGSAFLYGGALAGNRITSYVPVLVIGNPGFQPRDGVGTLPNAELTSQ